MEKIEDLQQQFLKFRKEWTEKITTNSQLLRDVSSLTELQINIFSDRQYLTEYLSKLTNIYVKKNRSFREKKLQVLEEYTNEKNIRYVASEKNIALEGKLKDDFYSIEILETQIKFSENTLRTIDSIIYAVKYRLQIKEHEY